VNKERFLHSQNLRKIPGFGAGFRSRIHGDPVPDKNDLYYQKRFNSSGSGGEIPGCVDRFLRLEQGILTKSISFFTLKNAYKSFTINKLYIFIFKGSQNQER
jgi:hypothetical protein